MWKLALSSLALTVFTLFFFPTSSRSELLNVSNSGDPLVFGGSSVTLEHWTNSLEGYDINDVSSGSGPPGMYSKNFKIVTKPYSVELVWDSRPTNSQTLFHCEISASDKNNFSAILNTSTNRIGFNIQEDLNTNRLWIVKLHRNSANNISGQDIDIITNVIIGAGGYTYGNKFYFNLTGITNLTSGTSFGYVDISCLFTNQSFSAGSKYSFPNDLTHGGKQVSGLEYVVTSGPAHGNAAITGGMNLIYSATNNYTGSDRVAVNLRWPVGSTNVLGTIFYAITVTNLSAPSATSVNYSNGSMTLIFSGLPGYTYRLQAATNLTNPDWLSIATNTAGTNSLWSAGDLQSTNFGQRFYRTIWP